MGDKLNLNVEARDVHGKKVAKLRKEGIVPGVIYGPGMEPVSIQVQEGPMTKTMRQAGYHTPVYLTVNGKKKLTMIKDTDVDPVKGTIRHVSFHAVKASDPVVAEVPIRLVGEGESEAEKAGLIVLQTLEKIEVRALPAELPEALEADIRGLKEAGEKLLLADVTLPEKVELVEHETGHGDEEEEERQHVTDLVIASVWEPSALQAANEAAAGDAEDEADVESDHGEDTPQDSQEHEDRPGGKSQDEPKQTNVDAVKEDEK